jgi:regulator of replication initiation timing
VNAADFDLLNRISIVDAQLKALQAELERVIIDNHLLREENERLRRERPEALR